MSFALVAVLALAAPAAAPAPPAPAAKEQDSDVLMKALVEGLSSSFKSLKEKSQKDAPLYYLSYRVADGTWFVDSASFGASEDTASDEDDPTAGRIRYFDVSARVGSTKLDNTHKVRGGLSFDFERGGAGANLPLDDDPLALRIALWRSTDRAYKSAAKQLIKVKANLSVKVEEEDKADDFSLEPARVQIEKKLAVAIDRKEWGERLKRLSAIFKAYPEILRSSVTLQAGGGNFYFVDSEGVRLREPRFFARVMISGQVKADDGMDLELYEDLEAQSPDQLPTEEELRPKVLALIGRLRALRTAPVVEPYSGPAIIMNRAAGVFFHEIFGHRVEGHRQKDADEGHTFTKKVGQHVVPDFISVVDDPTRRTFGSTTLNGYYQSDDEGVAAQKAVLVDAGVLKGFLMDRSPIAGFARSNGHGRAQPGLPPVARQGNLIVSSTRQLSFDRLRAALVDEVKKRGKPYGLIFQDIAGGFTNTRTGGLPQAFKVIPLVVYRVYPDGRPDELVRGVDMVGTPLTSFERILSTGDDFQVFNGFCGAESGWVPVSAVAPSLLIEEIEVEKKSKGHERGPLLPPPPLEKPGKEGAK